MIPSMNRNRLKFLAADMKTQRMIPDDGKNRINNLIAHMLQTCVKNSINDELYLIRPYKYS